MPGTIEFSGRFQVKNGNYDSGVEQFQGTIVQNNVGGGNPGTITATTTAAAISHGVTTLGMARLRNLDTTNFVTVGPIVSGVFYPMLQLNPKEPPQTIRLSPGITIGVKADTASCKIHVQIWEN